MYGNTDTIEQYVDNFRNDENSQETSLSFEFDYYEGGAEEIKTF